MNYRDFLGQLSWKSVGKDLIARISKVSLGDWALVMVLVNRSRVAEVLVESFEDPNSSYHEKEVRGH